MYFRRAEPVNVHLRKMTFDVPQQILVPFQVELRMQAPLHQNLVAAEVDCLLDFVQQFPARQHVPFRIVRLAKEARRSRKRQCRYSCN